MTLGRRAAGEGVATALLLATIIGSGVMGENLAGGNVAIALLGREPSALLCSRPGCERCDAVRGYVKLAAA